MVVHWCCLGEEARDNLCHSLARFLVKAVQRDGREHNEERKGRRRRRRRRRSGRIGLKSVVVCETEKQREVWWARMQVKVRSIEFNFRSIIHTLACRMRVEAPQTSWSGYCETIDRRGKREREKEKGKESFIDCIRTVSWIVCRWNSRLDLKKETDYTVDGGWREDELWTAHVKHVTWRVTKEKTKTRRRRRRRRERGGRILQNGEQVYDVTVIWCVGGEKAKSDGEHTAIGVKQE